MFKITVYEVAEPLRDWTPDEIWEAVLSGLVACSKWATYRDPTGDFVNLLVCTNLPFSINQKEFLIHMTMEEASLLANRCAVVPRIISDMLVRRRYRYHKEFILRIGRKE